MLPYQLNPKETLETDEQPLPGPLARGSCLGVVVRYKATEKVPIASELVITSDDPTKPVKTLDVMAYTIWNECGCKQRCDKMPRVRL